METLSTTIKVSLPNYLGNLPIPNSFGGIFRLSVSDWFRLVPLVGSITAVTYLTVQVVKPIIKDKLGLHLINEDIKKNCDKVVDVVDVEDMASDKVAYCRCWKSAKFPLCDGKHNLHNKLTGDNVGPLLVKK